MKMDDNEVLSAYAEYEAGNASSQIKKMARLNIRDDLQKGRRFLVVREDEESGEHRPANCPVVHSTEHSALAEAERLARRDRARFYVYQASRRVRVNEVTIERV